MKEVDTVEGLKQALAANNRVVVYFHSERCPPCLWVSPIYREMEVEFPAISFITADIDTYEDLGEAFNVSCMPTFLFFLNSAETSRFSGSSGEKLYASLYKLSLSK